jgi:hypothetical protein
MDIPEPTDASRAFRKFRCPSGDIIAGYWAVTKYVAQTIAKLIAKLGHSLLAGDAVGAAIAAIVHKGDLGVGWAKDMIDCWVNLAIQFDGSGSWHWLSGFDQVATLAARK